MWQKIKCWLGWHEWEEKTFILPNGAYSTYKCKIFMCKHCGKAKR